MSSMDEATVRRVAHLARLKISDEEVARFADQLSSILHYMEQLNELDTADVPPTAHARSVSNVFRADAARPSSSPDAVSSPEASSSPDASSSGAEVLVLEILTLEGKKVGLEPLHHDP